MQFVYVNKDGEIYGAGSGPVLPPDGVEVKTGGYSIGQLARMRIVNGKLEPQDTSE